jgi:protein-S-isoprenylcysteine O-methyltransferase Ste14
MEIKIPLAISIGILAYAIAILFDVVSMKKLYGMKIPLILLVLGLHAYALFLVLWNVEHFNLPFSLSILGWIILTVSLFLLLYSLVIEIPSKMTYIIPGESGRLVKTGTYALTRHPGVLWYLLAAIGLILGSKSEVLLIVAPVWVLLDIIYVIIQDKLLFVKKFAEYRQYQQETPMLIPSGKSIRACIRTCRYVTDLKIKSIIV